MTIFALVGQVPRGTLTEISAQKIFIKFILATCDLEIFLLKLMIFFLQLWYFNYDSNQLTDQPTEQPTD